jgi:hypothetical protein
VKTVSEGYTPLHLAARLTPHKPACSCSTDGGERVEPDSSEDTSVIDYLLKECKDVDVSAIKMLL